MHNDLLKLYYITNISESNPDNKIYGDAIMFLGEILNGDYVINFRKGT